LTGKFAKQQGGTPNCTPSVEHANLCWSRYTL